tara:strand:+ start:120 stop:494 length:375 start_codon:yes stop_codon:yes gene_type:complete
MEKYLYFRTSAALADDDASADSLVVPVANFKGAHPAGDDSIKLMFRSLNNEYDNGTNAVVISDTVVLTTGTNKAKEALQDIVAAINAHPNGDPFIVVADDTTSSYVGSGNITACGAITVASAAS